MPKFDPETNSFSLRIAYDGASEAGKTTTLRSLAELLGGKTETPKEVAGRTTFFDWLEHSGGNFQGKILQCSLVTVPGQRTLLARRRHLLEAADAVVFVVDSSPAGCDAAREPLRELRQQIEHLDPPAAFLLQANKRDLPEALPLAEIRSRLGLEPLIGITGTLATTGSGVRATYVLAVRLALERLKVMLQSGALAELNPEDHDPDQLLAELQGLDLSDARESLLKRDPGSGVRSSPRLPDSTIPVGHLWPPIAGRVLMAEAEQEEAVLEQHPSGTWLATSPSWRYRSDAEAAFHNRHSARRRLIDWCRWHAQFQSLLSTQRVLSLAHDEGEQGWRLWQVVRELPALDLELDRLLGSWQFDEAHRLLDAAEVWAQTAAEHHETQNLLAYADLSSLTNVDRKVTFREFASPASDIRSTAFESSDLLRQIARYRRQIANRP
ncbi:MAG: ADP-ribosylation factor-like protein [Acidobacteriota bacterium]